MATLIHVLVISVFFYILSRTPSAAFAGIDYEDGYSVSTLFDGNKLQVYPHSVLPQPGSSDLFLLDSTHSTVYTVSVPESGEVSLERLAGNGMSNYSDGDLSSAMFYKPKSFAVDARGNLYVADAKNKHAIRKISKSGVTTIAGGVSDTAGKKDGSGKEATFSDEYELVFVPQRCAIIISDIGNRLVRQINLRAADCSTKSQSGLGSTMSWFLGVGLSCLFGLVVGFVLRPFVIPHGGSRHLWYKGTSKHCLMNLGRQVRILCFELRSAVVNSSSYSLLKQIICLSFSHLSLMFISPFTSRRVVETWKPYGKTVSLLDLDCQNSNEPAAKYPRIIEAKDAPLLDLDGMSAASQKAQPILVDNEMNDLIHFDDGFLLSYNSGTVFHKENEGAKEYGRKGKIDSMIEANLSGLAEMTSTTSSMDCPDRSMGLSIVRKRVK
ncbi:unnamed protein product [Cuscuta epithymum]|uniref:NHL repeat-containing protein n=1 Tax=Cuscuta epithymum TaxID=186058 RepID=A0AAV0ECK8_9ASTE|nr:unnamed protein product [Cuscuta epithymum]